MTLRFLAVDVTGAEVSTAPSTPSRRAFAAVPGGDEVCDCYRTQVPCREHTGAHRGLCGQSRDRLRHP